MPDLVIPNLVNHDLKILFVGINPGTRSAAVGHHFAGRSNRFWKFLYESGLTPMKLAGELDYRMLELGYGITNLVHRSTATAAELNREEMKEGAKNLLLFILEYRPKVAAFLGKDIYRYYARGAGKELMEFQWGLQPGETVPGVIDFVLPNPSGLNRIPIPNQLEIYRMLKQAIDPEGKYDHNEITTNKPS
jgi:TDG/mug DNA glycosylase family protein